MAATDPQEALPHAPRPPSAQASRLARRVAARPQAPPAELPAGLLESVHDGIFVRDMDGVVTHWNRGAEALYGWTATEAIGHPVQRLIQTTFPAPLENINEALLRRGCWQGELQHICKDGQPRIVASRWVLQRDEHGAAVAVLQTSDDVTERRHAEHAERELQELWRAAFEANPTMYFIVDEAGAIESVNRFGAQQLGYEVGELVGQPVLDVFCEPDRAFVQGNASNCFADPGRTMRWEARKMRKDGKVLWVRETANAVMLRNRPVLLVACEDVTERKRAEEALRDSEERFRTLVQFSFDLYWETDKQHRFVRQEFGPSLADAFAPRAELGQTRWEVPSLEPDEETWRRHRETLEAHLPFRDFEIARPTPGGGKRYVSVSGLPVFDDTGAFTGYRGVGRVITQRKRAEELLRAHLWFLESLDRINRAMHGTNDLEQMMSDVLDAVLEVFACDRAWLVYPCDPEAAAWRAVMEHTRPHCPGAFALDADVPLDAEVAQVFRAAVETEGAVLFGPGHELQVPAPVAERFAVRSQMVMAVRPKVDRAYLFGLHQCSHARVWSEQETRLFEEVGRRLDDALTSLLIFRSLRESYTELRRAQEERSASELLTRHVFESAPDGMAVIGRDYRYRRVNPVHERTWKIPAERIVGLHVADLFGDPVFEQTLKPNLDRCFAGEQVSFAEWFVNAGGRVYYSVIYTPLRLGSEQVEAALAITRDLTDHMLASQALRDAEAALARVNRVTTLGVLTASIAHEVNQPLGAMVTSAAACTRWLAAQPPEMEKACSALQRITADGKRAGQVVERIRALVNRQAPRRDRLDVNEAILEVIALTHDEVHRKAITLHASLAPDMPPIEGDRVQLQQVVLNLLVNAIEAMNGSGARLRELAIASACDGADAVTVEVRDSGPGVDPGQMDRLFEAFYTTKEDGIGMGLSISRSIIEAHGGRLWVTPNVPHGAAFRISLPVRQPVP